jgi:predicted DNA-binding transcriptional regulator AlpA
MDDRKVASPSKLMRDRETYIAEVCEAVGVSRATLYRYLGPNGTTRKRKE